jgi:hypothetical protein
MNGQGLIKDYLLNEQAHVTIMDSRNAGQSQFNRTY